VDSQTADTVGVPVGSAEPAGGSDSIDGAETGYSPESGAREPSPPVAPTTDTED
jgi:hypothetical protein